MSTPRNILTTYALPYANGPLHLGHLLGTIQTDIWVRFQKMRGHHCLYIGGSDSHGTPIMIQAEKMGLSPEQMVTQITAEHQQTLQAFDVAFDNYYTTHAPENEALVTTIFNRHMAAGNIIKKTITQFFDPVKQLFLPDRYIKGTCPHCAAPDQYGDYCEVCGAIYAVTEIKEPRSILSGETPIQKTSEHYFFQLPHYESFLKQWTNAHHLQPAVTHKVSEWFQAGLKEWDISRDAPYFGFRIPNEPNKYFYVWLDAPVGYMASFQNFCQRNKQYRFEDYWNEESTTELYQFIGKDIMYFHALFWPALLHGAHYRTPTAIFAHGFVTIRGQKMSKSRGTFITAQTYLAHLPSEYLRYYFAAKLTDKIEDLDIQFEDFVNRINADLVGKFINIASRTAPFITQYASGKLSKTHAAPALQAQFSEAGNHIAACLEALQYSQAIKHIMQLADQANQYIEEHKPWFLAKDNKKQQIVVDIATVSLNLFRLLTLYLKPILPKTTSMIETFLNIPPLTWHDKETVLLDHTIQPFKPLLQRIDLKQMEALTMTTESTTTAATPPSPTLLTIEDFNKVDLRVAQIIEATTVEGADKLLRLIVDLGHETRQIFAGIKAAFQPEQLIGKKIIIVANLAPRKMRFGLSEGMALIANSDQALYLVSADPNTPLGAQVK